MGRRSIWQPTGASCAATSVSVLFFILLHLTVVPIFISADTTTDPTNTTTITTTASSPTCNCNDSTFCYIDRCLPLLNLNLTVLAVSSNESTLFWSIIEKKPSNLNVSLNLTCASLNQKCKNCEAHRDAEFNQVFTISNLEFSSLLLFKAVAKWSNTVVSHPSNVSVLTLPLLPDNLAFTPVDPTVVNVTWTSYVSCIDSHLEIRNSTSDKILNSTSIDEQEVLIRSLNPGTKEILQARAVVTAGEKMQKTKPYSLSVKTPPMPPAGLKAARNAFSLNVTFKAPSVGQYDYFELEYLHTNGSWIAAGNTNASDFVLVSDLGPFRTYRLRARAVSLNLSSSYYEINATTGEYTPNAPEIVEHNTSHVLWKPPDKPNGDILGYQLHWTLSCGKLAEVKKQFVNVSAGRRSWQIPSGFELPGYHHCIRIRAYNSYSFGNWSSNSCSSKHVNSTLGPELNISTSSHNANVTWSSTTCPGLVVGYFFRLQRRKADKPGIDVACLPGSRRLKCSNCNSDHKDLFPQLKAECGDNAADKTFETEISEIRLTSLQPGNVYRAILYSAGSDHNITSRSRNFSTKQVQSSQPQNPSGTAVSEDALTVTWDPPQTPGGLILHYLAFLDTKPHQCFLCNCTGCDRREDYVELTAEGQKQLDMYRGLRCHPCVFKPQQGPTSAVKFDNLTAFTNYTINVRAVNSLGFGSSNASAQFTTKQGTPDAPSQVRITAVTDTSVTVEWLQPPNARGILTGYLVRLNSRDPIHKSATTTSETFTNLSACTKFKASVIARNSAHNSTPAISGGNFTQPTKPSAVASLELRVINSTSLEATWKATENVGECLVTYRVILQNANINRTINNTSLVFSRLKPFTNYIVKVFVIVTSRDGSSQQLSSPSYRSNTTEEGTPSKPKSLRCPAKNYTSISCSWEPPDPTNGNLIVYEVSVFHDDKAKHSYNGSGTSNTFNLVSVPSGDPIYVYVRAFTSAGPGDSAKTETKLLDGPPILSNINETDKDAMKEDADKVTEPHKQIKIKFNKVWFDSIRGKITKYTVIVKCCEVMKKDDEKMLTWLSSDAGSKGPYVAKNIKGETQTRKRRRKRSSSDMTSVIIGNDSACTKNKEYCNGPLKSGTKYYIYIRGYIKGLSSTLDPVEATTAMAPERQDNSWIAALVVCLILIVAAFFGFFAFRQWRNKKKVPKQPEPINGISNPFVKPEQLEMKPLAAVNASVPDLASMVSRGLEVDVPLEHFEEFVEEMNRDSRLKYSDAFSEVKKQASKNEIALGLTIEEAAQQYNRLKNRFANVLPFDQTRVCLSSDDDPFSGMDYINANFVSGNRRTREFIACQGPLQQTLDDFWRMLWEQNVSLLVMLTKTVEKGRNKCEQYWPNETNEPRVYGDIAVRLLSESDLQSHVVRVLSLTLKGDCRRLTHLQMLTWDDFLAPSPEDLTDVMRAYRSHLPPPNGNRSESPTVVHCSAGVGRTGTFICLDTMVRRLESGHGTINVNAVIYAMRRQRRMLVQSERQYIFIHDFLVYYLQRRRAAIEGQPTVGQEGSRALLDAAASHVNNAYEKEDFL